jgi:uridine kinase
MKEIKININGKKEIIVSKRICAYDILSEFGENDDEIIAVKINNETCSLTQVIDINCTLKPIYLKTHEGSAIYRRTLCFVLAAAAQELFPAKRLLVGHSLGYGYYYTFDSDFVLQQKDLENLEKHMRKLIYADHIIKQS